MKTKGERVWWVSILLVSLASCHVSAQPGGNGQGSDESGSKSVSNRAPLAQCTFVFTEKRGLGGDIKKYQDFRKAIQETGRDVPLLIQFSLDGRMYVVFHRQCEDGLKFMRIIKSSVDRTYPGYLDDFRSASPEEFKRLTEEINGTARN